MHVHMLSFALRRPVTISRTINTVLELAFHLNQLYANNLHMFSKYNSTITMSYVLNINKKEANLYGFSPMTLHIYEHYLRGQQHHDISEVNNVYLRVLINMLRMEPAMCYASEALLTPRLFKKDTNYRRASSPGLKLAITLKYMTARNRYKTLV